jgi:hypothetical protein
LQLIFRGLIIFVCMILQIAKLNATFIPLTVQEIDGSPSVSKVKNITFNGATLTDLLNGRVLVTVSSAATAAGSTGAIQFNNSNALAAAPELSWNDGLNSLNVQGTINGQDLVAKGTLFTLQGLFTPQILNTNTVSSLKIRSEVGTAIRNNADTGDAPFSAGAITSSGGLAFTNTNPFTIFGNANSYVLMGSGGYNQFGFDHLGRMHLGNASGGSGISGFYWASGANYNISQDAAFIRSGTAQLDVRADNGLRIRNFANNADAPLSAASLNIGTGVFRIDASQVKLEAYGAYPLVLAAMNTGAVVRTHGASLEVKNIDNTAFAPINAGNGTLSGVLAVNVANNRNNLATFYGPAADYPSIITGADSTHTIGLAWDRVNNIAQINSSSYAYPITINNGSLRIDPGNGTGKITSGGSITINNTTASDKVLIAKGAASQTANLQEWQNNAGTALTVISNGGNLGIGTNSPARKLHISQAMRLEPLGGSQPASPSQGDLYSDNDTGTLCYYDGSTWVAIGGGSMTCN